MRILAIADIHGVMSVYEWLVELVEEYKADLLLIAGDLFAADWEAGQREQARQIIPVLKRVAAPCFYIVGNDDNVAFDFENEQIKPLHGRRRSYGTYNLVGYQFTPPFMGKLFVKSEEEIDEDLLSLEPLLEMSCLSWNWRERSSVKITERAHEKRAKALHRGREGSHPEEALAG